MQSLSQQFLDYCRTKPADEEYRYEGCQQCALFQFLTAAGYPVFTVGPRYWSDIDGGKHELPIELLPQCYDGGGVISLYPRTFGAVVERFEALA